MPPAKAPTSVMKMPEPVRMAMAAPTVAPDETPRMSGDTIGFLNIDW